MKDRFFKIGKDYFVLRSKEKDFHRNTYFRLFRGNGKKVSMILDPGTKQDLSDILNISKELFGGINNLDLIFISHQDPDLTSVLPSLIAIAPRARIMASIDTWRLIKMYGDISERRFIAVEDFKSDVINIKSTGHRLKFVSAMYCHFRGAMMLYDYENKILFSGDFLGGVDTKKEGDIYADETSWEGIKIFHEIYMPITGAVKETIDRITTISPFPEIIAPQHGNVIKGGLVMDFLSRLYDLQVGYDLIKKFEPEKELTISAINDFFEQAKNVDPSFVIDLIAGISSAGNFTSPFVVKGDVLTDFKLPTSDAIKTIWSKIEFFAPPDKEEDLKTMYISSLEQFNVPHNLKLEEKIEGNFEDIFD